MPEDHPAHGPESPEKGGETRPAQESAAAPPEGDAPAEAPCGLEPVSDPGAAVLPAEQAAEAYHRRARLAEDRLGEVLAAYRKLKGENEAYRERATRNIERRYEQRRERLLAKFMEILDNLDRALDAAEGSQASDDLIQGLILVRTQLLQTLQVEGLERIPVLGLAYDPAVSEAVGTQPVDDLDLDQTVVKELVRGYRLNGRLARASRVMVGMYQPSEAEGDGPPSRAERSPGPAAPAEAEPTLEEIVARAEDDDEASLANELGLEVPAGDDDDRG